MKITIMRDQLIAALFTAGKEDIRPYLNGVYIEATNTETRLTSSNGTTLAMQRADAKGDNQINGIVKMIVPRHALEGVKNHKISRTVEINDDDGKLGLVDCSTRTNFEPVEGRFPDFRRIIPAQTSGVVSQFDTTLIVLFAKAAKVLGATYKGMPQVAIAHNDSGADKNAPNGALVTLGDLKDYVGVLMPMRFEAPSTPPDWATSQLVDDEDLV